MQKRLNMKKLVFVIGLLMIASVTAIWTYNVQSNKITANVVSLEPDTVLYFAGEFSNASLDVTLGADSAESVQTLVNDNGDLTLRFNASESILDESDACTDYADDCTITYEINGSSVTSGEIIDFEGSGASTEIKAIFDCIQNACPQDLETTIILSTP